VSQYPSFKHLCENWSIIFEFVCATHRSLHSSSPACDCGVISVSTRHWCHFGIYTTLVLFQYLHDTGVSVSTRHWCHCGIYTTLVSFQYLHDTGVIAVSTRHWCHFDIYTTLVSLRYLHDTCVISISTRHWCHFDIYTTLVSFRYLHDTGVISVSTRHWCHFGIYTTSFWPSILRLYRLGSCRHTANLTTAFCSLQRRLAEETARGRNLKDERGWMS
jgi:hypothetical protein